MTRFSVLTLILCSILCSTAIAQERHEESKSLSIGSYLDLSKHVMVATSGERMVLNSIAQHNGLVVIFSCNECPFVVAWEDRYKKIAAFAKDNGFGVALINSNEAKRTGDIQVDNFEAMVLHDKEMGYNQMEIFYLMDKGSQLADNLQAKVTPHVFLFDRDRILRYTGAIDDNYRDAFKVSNYYLLDAMESLANGMEVEVEETKALGCSIKRLKN